MKRDLAPTRILRQSDNPTIRQDGAVSPSRTEAFSDGVLAVVITLLVLDLHADSSKGDLARQLRHTWPTFVAYLISFFVVGVI